MSHVSCDECTKKIYFPTKAVLWKSGADIWCDPCKKKLTSSFLGKMLLKFTHRASGIEIDAMAMLQGTYDEVSNIEEGNITF
jgi:hypothetical protein